MAPEKNRVYKSVLEPAPMLSILKIDLLFAYTENFWNTIIRSYSINPVAC